MPHIGAASNYFASIYVADAGRAVVAALDVPAGIYNVCDDEPVSFAEYLHTLTKAHQRPQTLPSTSHTGKVDVRGGLEILFAITEGVERPAQGCFCLEADRQERD